LTAFESQTNKKILVLGAFGGRIDHTLSAMHVMYKIQIELHQKNANDHIILMDQFSKMICLMPGVQYDIQLNPKIDLVEGVGLIPIPLN
jgi:thiamine pyrophosphokinase